MSSRRDAVADPVSHIHAAISPVSANGLPTDEELDRINKEQALEPLTADQIYVFRMEISNNLRDSYYTRMDPDTTLVNYRDNFRQGRSIMNSHEHRELPIGRSFDADLVDVGEEGNPSDPKRRAVVLKGYLQRGIQLGRVSNDHVIRGIQGGTLKDGSIGFAGGDYECSICGGDMSRWDECEHFPGETYSLDGGRSAVAEALIRNAEATEGSLVYDGATPHAMVRKAEDLASQGRLNRKQVRRLESLYGCRINAPTSVREAPSLEPDPERLWRSFIAEVAPHIREAAEFLGRDVIETLWARHGVAPSQRATWTTAYVNDLPDSAFAYIEAGGSKDSEGKTTPRSLRHFPHHDDSGKPDEAHVRNALARIPQSDVSDEGKTRALHHVEAHARDLGIEVSDSANARSKGGTRLEPLNHAAIAQLVTDAIAPEQRRNLARSMYEGREDQVDPAFVGLVAAAVVIRAGASLHPDTASAIQGVLDQMQDAHDAHAAAMASLNSILDLTPIQTTDDLNPTVGLEDMDPAQTGSGSTAGSATPNGTNPATPPNGQVGRGRSPEEGQPGGAGLAGSIAATLQTVASTLNDLAAQVMDGDGDDDDIALGAEGRAEREAARAESRMALERALKGPGLTRFRELLDRAQDGIRYRRQLVGELHQWGVRAKGNAYNRELYERLVASLSVAELEGLAREWEIEAFRRYARTPAGELPDWFQGPEGLATRIGRQTEPKPNPYAIRQAPVATTTIDVSDFRQPHLPPA